MPGGEQDKIQKPDEEEMEPIGLGELGCIHFHRLHRTDMPLAD